MTSSRLPGKVLKVVMGKPLLEYQIERLRRVRLADDIVIATTTNDSDIPIVDLCVRLGISVTRGSEHDVLARYYEAAMQHQADVIVRVTSDCPVIDPLVVDGIIRFYLDHQAKYDYVSSGLIRSCPLGMDAEVFSLQVLQEAFAEALDKAEREHVTPFIYLHPERYRLANYSCPEDLADHRWTVDTPEDFELIGKIIEALYPLNQEFGLLDIANLLKVNPDWVAINAHVEQKKLGQ